MKVKLLVVCLLVMYQNCFAQKKIISDTIELKSNFVWSELNKETSSLINAIHINETILTIKVNQNGFVYSRKSNTVFHQYDDSMKLIQKVPFALKYNGKNAVPRKLVKIDDKVFLLYIGYDESEDLLLISEVDLETLKVNETPRVLTRSFEKCRFYFEQSEDKKYIGVFELGYGKVKEAKQNKMKCYDTDFQLLYETSISVNIPSRRPEMSQVAFDDEGGFFTIIQTPSNELSDNTFTGVYWSYQKDKGESITRRLGTNRGVFLKNLGVTISNDSVLLVGYYSKEWASKGFVKGLVYVKFHKSEVYFDDFTVMPFSTDLLNFASTKANWRILAKKDEVEECRALKVMELKEWEGHGYLLVGESWYSSEQSNTPSTYKEVGNLVITLFDYSLNPLWSVPIKKNHAQNYFIQTYSYFLSVDKNMISVIINGNSKKDYGKGMIFFQIKPDGSYSNHQLTDEDIKIYPRKSFRLKENEYFVYSRHRLKDRLGILKLE